MLTKKLVLAADSKEVEREYHLGKIKQLEDELNRLNLLDNPREIQAICKQIILIKALLQKNKFHKR